MSSGRALRKRNIPFEVSSSVMTRATASECAFPVNLEMVVRKRNMPYEPLSSEVIEIVCSRYGFLMNLEGGGET